MQSASHHAIARSLRALSGEWWLRVGHFSHAAEANGVRRQARVAEAGVFAEPIGGAQAVGGGFPRPAAEDVFASLGRAAWVLVGAFTIVVFAVDILAPLGHVAVHVE